MANAKSTQNELSKLLLDIRKATLPIFVSNWIFGLGIIEYPFGTQHRLISFLYTASIIMIYSILAINSHHILQLMIREFMTNPIIVNTRFIFQVFMCISTTTLGWYRSKGMRRMLGHMAVADYMLDLIGIPKNYVQVFKTQIKKVTGFLLFVLIVITINGTNILTASKLKSGTIVHLIAANYPTVIVFVVDTTFINIIEYVRFKLKKLNGLLKSISTTTKDYPQHARISRALSKVYRTKLNPSEEYITKDNTYIIYIAKKAHLELVKTCKIVDNTFGLHIMMSLTFAVAVTIESLYHLYIILRHAISDRELIGLFGSIVIRIIYYSSKMLMYCYCCGAVSEESIKTGDIISEFYDEPVMTEEAKNEIRNFHTQLIENALIFKACGFITIDATLIQSIIGVITTYLVILIQLGNS